MFLRRNFPFPWKILVHRCVIIVRGTIPIFFRSTFFRSLRDSRERDNFSRSRWPRGRRGSASSEVLRFKHLSTRVMEGRGDQVGSSTRVLTLFRSSRNYIHFPTLPGCILLSSFREYFSLRVAPVLVVWSFGKIFANKLPMVHERSFDLVLERILIEQCLLLNLSYICLYRCPSFRGLFSSSPVRKSRRREKCKRNWWLLIAAIARIYAFKLPVALLCHGT